MEGRHVHPSTLYPGGVGTMATIQTFTDYLVRLMKYVEFMFFRDQTATVAGVFTDLDDRTYVAVTVDADPAAELHGSFGRFFYFDPGEIEPLGEARS